MKEEMKYLIIAGMPRAGTTFLHLYLKKHPEINAASLKEINFFSHKYEKGISWYEDLFGGNQDDWNLDASPVYFFDDSAIQRISEMNPQNTRVIIGVRKPEDWIVSFYKQVSRHFIRPPEFDAFSKGHQWNVEGATYDLSFRDGFLKDRVTHIMEKINVPTLFFDFDYLEQNPLSLLKKIEEFVGVSSWFTETNFDNAIINSSDRKSNKIVTYLMNRSIAKRLIEIIPDSFKASLRDAMTERTAVSTKRQVSETENYSNLIASHDQDDRFLMEVFRDQPTLEVNRSK